ncbi:hypothetical protein GIB67_018089 [Kingdonia uniflora]|uniref:PHD-type domain-containing protein n=1 Tax=Kingdonia uniflora TaxID=39325 RepID=A0A7J7NWI8_9MAGN|nr:hypothetical protein GIB67_018089 [Kingdonia uniflora]
MAKGTDSEEFVLLSGSQSGAKREFGVGLNVQSELCGSLGRTRPREFENCDSSNGGSENLSCKRLKISGGNEEELEKALINGEGRNGFSECLGENESLKHLVKLIKDEELRDNFVKEECQEDPASDFVAEDSEGNVEILLSNEEQEKFVSQWYKKEGTEVNTPTDIVHNSEKLRNGYVKRESEREHVNDLVHAEESEGNVQELLSNVEHKKIMSQLHREEGTGVDTPTVIEHNRKDLRGASKEKPVCGLMLEEEPESTVENLSSNEEHGNIESQLQKEGTGVGGSVENLMNYKEQGKTESQVHRELGTWVDTPSTIEHNSNVGDSIADKPVRRFTRSALIPSVDSMVIDDSSIQIVKTFKTFMRRCIRSNIDSKMKSLSTDGANEIQNNKTKSPIEIESDGKTPVTIDTKSEKPSFSLEKPIRRFTRSTLKPKVESMPIVANSSESDVEPMVIDDDKEEHDTVLKEPLKCFTRSALKSNVLKDVCKDPVIAQSADEATYIDSSHEKLKMKMLKNVALTKCPTKANELLETGMFEGLPIKYIYQNKELRGTIKDGGVLCFCKFCNGCKIITTSEFERHARSRNKHPAYYIHLDNGRSLCEVLNACKHAPLDMLDATIQRAIGSLSAESANICLKCERDLPAPCTKKVILLCDSCLNLKKTPGRISSKKPQESLERSSVTDVRSSESLFTQKTMRSSLKSKLLQNDSSQGNLTKKPSEPVSTRKSLRSSLKSISLQNDSSQGNLTAKSRKPILTPKSLNEVRDSKSIAGHNRSHGKLTRKDLRLHRLVFEKDGLPDGAELAYYARGQKVLEGYKKGFGIFCRCCNSEISPSQFEAHAGYAPRRKPYLHIFTSNGVCLHELSLSLSKGRKLSANDNDDLCGICADFGDLLLCDGCPRAFHKECVGQSSIPRGKWYCAYCQNAFADRSCATNDNAKAAGRVSGVDPIEQISKRCIRIVKTQETTEVGGCSLCRHPSFSKSRFGPSTVILCDQCEKEFHVGCLSDHKMADLKQLPKGKWFCCKDCSRIHSVLQRLIVRGSEKLPDSILNNIKKKPEGDGLHSNADGDVRWTLLSGKVASSESRSLLSKAVAIFHNRFDPIVDAITGRDLIPCMVFGRNMREQDFGGMYCAVLTVNSLVVSAGLIRILGQEVAELPLVATSSEFQGQGYFQSLFSCIERLLGFFCVKNLVLPAAQEAEAIWTEKFGFTKMSQEEVSKYVRDCQMTIFKGTSMLQKSVPKCKILSTPTDESKPTIDES